MYTNQKCFNSIFSPRRIFEPAVVVNEITEDGEIEEVLKPKQKKKDKYLPGERLLVKLNKENQNQKEKKILIDEDKIMKSLNNMLKLF